jgi:flagellar basal body-associated protein FliL
MPEDNKQTSKEAAPSPAAAVATAPADMQEKKSFFSRLFGRSRSTAPTEEDAEDLAVKRSEFWTQKVEKRWSYFCKNFSDVAGGLWDRDRSTRRMSAFFLISAAGAIFIASIALERYSQYRHKSTTTKVTDGVEKIGEFLGKQAEEAKRRHTTMNLGSFIIELKTPAGTEKRRGVLNTAEIEIVLECDNKDTCHYVDENHIQAKNQITNVLVPMERDELMSLDGKKKIKKALIEKLNSWLPKGKVENLYFASLIVT